MIEVGAWERNAEGLLYSTPYAAPTDEKDGAGIIYAWSTGSFCGLWPTPGWAVDADDFTIDLDGGEPMPSGEVDYVEPLSYQDPGPTDGRVRENVFKASMDQGKRIRAVLTWNMCPPFDYQNVSYVAPAVAGIDFDLFLRNNTTGVYNYGSQSVDDNREGFDVRVPADGNCELMVAWSDSVTVNCDQAGEEDVSVAWAFEY